jgi:hypothetical protein
MSILDQDIFPLEIRFGRKNLWTSKYGNVVTIDIIIPIHPFPKFWKLIYDEIFNSIPHKINEEDFSLPNHKVFTEKYQIELYYQLVKFLRNNFRRLDSFDSCYLQNHKDIARFIDLFKKFREKHSHLSLMQKFDVL